MKKTCIIIAGPTASGKTALAVDIARHFSTEIISADSRQCFRELNIGVAKPSDEELNLAHHYFINSHTVTDEISAADFEKYALHTVEKIFDKNDVAVMVGGTGLYIKAFCEGLDEIPAANPEVRKMIIDNYEEKGIQWLEDMIEKNDQLYFQKGEMQNPQRMMRALEVALASGKSILSFQTKQKIKREFNIIKIGLQWPREILYQRINQRVDDMIRQGLLDEVRSLISFKSLNALQTVGYRELFDFFEGKFELNEAVEKIKQNTRHYAKRQMAWFKKDEEMKWFDYDKAKILEYLNYMLEHH